MWCCWPEKASSPPQPPGLVILAYWAEENFPRADLDSSLWKIISTFEIKFVTASMGICFHLEKSQRKHPRMKQREEYRDVLIIETESSHVIWLTSQTSSQESVHTLSRWKMVPMDTPGTTASVECDPLQTKVSFKQKEWQHRTRIWRS